MNKTYWSLTSAFCVHSNVYTLDDIQLIRYLTAVNSFHSISPLVQKYHHLTSCSVEVPVVTTARNSSSIGKEPVSSCITMRMSATTRLVSVAEQGSITFTNVIQGYKTVVQIYCTIE